MLNATQDDQVVVVQRTTAGVPQAAPVESATVTITGPDGVPMTGVEVTDSTLTRVYHVTLSTFHEQLVPGGTYRLHVQLKTGEDVTGTTTIPDARPSLPPVAIVPFNEATDTLRLSWPAVQGAASYEVRVQSAAGVYAMFSGHERGAAGNAAVARREGGVRRRARPHGDRERGRSGVLCVLSHEQ